MSMLPDVSVPGADLPVRPALDELVEALGVNGTAVLVAPPGSGKTSLLPLALADAVDGRVIVAEPRRIATRAAAQRLAMLVGEQPGGRVGYAMRGERAPGTRIEVVTTGLLVQRLQRDPELAGVGAVVIDECHERHLDADLALAFCVDVRAALRPELALVATSATPDTAGMTRVLGDAPVVTATALTYGVDLVWAPPRSPLPLLADARVDPRLLDHVADVVRRALAEAAGDVLVFVPGEAEINGVSRRLHGVAADVLPLFGRQSSAEQDRALTTGPRRRIVITTSIAESSLTVPGVRIVVDAGLARQARTDQVRGLSALVTTKVSQASADQRAGRAGREAPGRVYRCWGEAEQPYLAAQTPAEILTADLAGFALTAAAWGAPGGAGLALLDQPPAPALDAASALLRSLTATDDEGRITDRGRAMAAIGAHPRLARAVLDGASMVGGRRAAEIVAMLSDDSLTGRDDDLPGRLRVLRAGRDRAAASRWKEEVRRLRRTESTVASTSIPDDLAVGTVVGLAYPDRIARSRQAASASYLMAGGTGAALAPESSLRGTPWLAIAVADRPIGRADARIRSAAPIDEATARAVGAGLVEDVDEIRWGDGELVLRTRQKLGAIVLTESRLTDPDPALVAEAVRDGLRRAGLSVLRWNDDSLQLRHRLAFLHAHLGEPWPAMDENSLVSTADSWLGPALGKIRRTRDLAAIDAGAALRRLLPWPAATEFDALAPERIATPTGSKVALRYDGAEPPILSLRVQQAFGWTAGPTVAGGRVPVTIHLLSPAGRPVAVTSDLASFWRQGYPQVRSELRGRYPRHPWPDDPIAAVPTSRVKPRR